MSVFDMCRIINVCKLNMWDIIYIFGRRIELHLIEL